MKNPNTPKKETALIGHIGNNGSYSHEAAKKYFKGGSFTSFNHFEDVFKALENKTVEYGVVPIENSSTGGIRDVYDLLVKCDVKVIGEVYLNIEHHLIGLAESSLEDIEIVCSHPQGLMQSSEFIRMKKLESKLCKDTGSAASLVKHSKDKKCAAVASESACRIHDLKILEKNISNFQHNTTRFFILSKKPAIPASNSITSLVFTTKHEPGCLYGALKHLSDYGINMMRIESRPIENKPWEYYFFVDIEGSLMESKIRSSLHHLKKQTSFFKILGSYKKSCV